jgi:hypothetical protein
MPELFYLIYYCYKSYGVIYRLDLEIIRFRPNLRSESLYLNNHNIYESRSPVIFIK